MIVFKMNLNAKLNYQISLLLNTGTKKIWEKNVQYQMKLPFTVMSQKNKHC